MKKLLIATDLSARADRAFQRAVALAHRLGAALEIVHVVDEALPTTIAAEQRRAARAVVDQLLAAAPGGETVDAAVEIVRGHPFEAILERARAIGAGLIVLGVTRHRLYELFHGTTAERVVRIGEFPVLLVKEPANEPYRKVLIATDASPAAQRAMACAVDAAPDAEFILLHTMHVPFKGLLGAQAQATIRAEQVENFTRRLEEDFRAVAERPNGSLPPSTIHLEEGVIEDAIRAAIARLKPDLLALGTHGRAGLRHFLIGSVAANLLTDPPVDVLVAQD